MWYCFVEQHLCVGRSVLNGDVFGNIIIVRLISDWIWKLTGYGYQAGNISTR